MLYGVDNLKKSPSPESLQQDALCDKPRDELFRGAAPGPSPRESEQWSSTINQTKEPDSAVQINFSPRNRPNKESIHGETQKRPFAVSLKRN